MTTHGAAKPPTPGELLKRLSETKLEDFFRSLPPNTAIIADWEFEQFFDRHLAHASWSLQCVRLRWGLIRANPQAAVSGFASLVICARQRESAIYAAVQAVAPDVPIYRLVADIGTCLSAQTEVLPAGEIERLSLPDELAKIRRLDIVVCLPRSGSNPYSTPIEEWWLKGRRGFAGWSPSLSAGITTPCGEDLRPHVVFLASRFGSTSFSLRNWLALTIRRLADGGAVASKVIATFLFDILDTLTANEVAALEDAFQAVPEVRIFYLKRRNRAMRAVSAYLSNNTDVWHLRGSQSLPPHAGKVPYDFEKIHNIYRRLESDEARLDAWVAQPPPVEVLELSYEDIQGAPEHAVASIASRLGIANTNKPSSRLRVTRSALNEEMAERFEQALKARASKASPPPR